MLIVFLERFGKYRPIQNLKPVYSTGLLLLLAACGTSSNNTLDPFKSSYLISTKRYGHLGDNDSKDQNESGFQDVGLGDDPNPNPNPNNSDYNIEPIFTASIPFTLFETIPVPISRIIYDANAVVDVGEIIYEMIGPDANLFDINSISGEVTFKEKTIPDYEDKPVYKIEIVAKANNLSVNQIVNIEVIDLDDKPTSLYLSQDNMNWVEGISSAQKLADIIFVDEDGGDNQVSIPENALFEIKNGTELWLKAGVNLDYEDENNPSHLHVVQVSSPENLDLGSVSYTLKITNKDDKPTSLSLSPNKIDWVEGITSAQKLSEVLFEDVDGGDNKITISENALFEVKNGNEIWLKSGQNLDFEGDKTSYDIEVSYAGSGLLGDDPLPQIFTLTVTNIDDVPPAAFSPAEDSSDIYEGVSDEKKLTDITFVDDDGGVNSITIPPSAIFEIRNKTQLWLKMGVDLDYEDPANPTHKYVIALSSPDNPYIRGSYTLYLNDLDDKPTEMHLSSSKVDIAEGVTTAQKLSDISFVDVDGGLNIIGVQDSELFEIKNETELWLKEGQNLDFESGKTSYEVVISYVGTGYIGITPQDMIFTLTVTDGDDKPTGFTLTPNSINLAEGISIAQKLGEAIFDDSDGGANRISISKNPIVEIRDNTEIWLKGGMNIDYENVVNPNHRYILGFSSPENPSLGWRSYRINITDSDDKPTEMHLSVNSIDLMEGTTTAKKLSEVTFVDIDGGANQIAVPENSIFEVKNNTEIWLKADVELDFESDIISYEAEISYAGPSILGEDPAPQILTLNVTNIDDAAPTSITFNNDNSQSSIAEGITEETLLATIDFVDADGGANRITIPPSDLFEVRDNNQLWLKGGAVIDYEDLSNPLHKYIAVISSPEHPDLGTISYTLTITDSDDRPTAMHLSSRFLFIEEGISPERKLADTTFEDIDGGVNRVSVPDSDIFQIKNGTELWLKAGVTFDFEGRITGHGLVVTYAGEGLVGEAPGMQLFLLRVSNVDDRPTIMHLSPATIELAEGMSVAQKLSDISFDDVDGGANQIMVEQNDLFEIKNNTELWLKAGVDLDFESGIISYDVEISYFGPGMLGDNPPPQIFTLKVTNIDDDAPTAITFNNENTQSAIAEGITEEKLLTIINFTGGEGLENSIIVPQNPLFEVRDSNQLWLKGGVEVDYEDEANPLHYHIAVLSSPEHPDLGTLSYKLNITDRDDKPISMRLSPDSLELSEGIRAARKLSEVVFEDVDGGGNQISVPENSIFEIKNNTELWLKAGVELDYESDIISYEAEISYVGPGMLGSNPAPHIFTLNVSNIDDTAPTSINFNNDNAQSTIAEGITEEKLLAAINIVDGDGGVNRITVPSSDLFEVRDNNQLWLKGGVEVDYEDEANPLHYHIAVLSSPEHPDLGTLSYKLNISDRDDKPISMRLSPDNIELSEGIRAARKLSEVILEDVDGGENQISVPENSIFEVRNNTEIWLKADVELDYESDIISYEAEISYAGPGMLGGNPAAQIFTLTVTNIDDTAPTSINFNNDNAQSTIAEGITGEKLLATIDIDDSDGGVNRITVPPSDLFEVRDNNQLWLKGGVEVDYEDEANPLHYHIAVLSSPEHPDLGTLSYKLNITDRDDKPISMRLSPDNIELSEGITTARKLSEVIFEDVDGGGNQISVPENSIFEVRNNTEIWLKAGVELDYESDIISYEAEISYAGPGMLGGNPPAQIFTLTVTNIDDIAPTSINFNNENAQSAIAEGITEEKLLATINIVDSDGGVNRITVPPSDLFEVRDNNQLWLKGGVEVDYEDEANPLHYHIAVLSSPEHPYLGTLSYKLIITDRDDKPISMRLSPDYIDLNEGITTARKLSEVIMEDVDGGVNQISIPENSIFEVRNNTEIWLKADVELEYESDIISHEAVISYAGPGMLGDNPPPQIFTLNVINIDDIAPTSFDFNNVNSQSAIAEGITEEKFLTTINFEDGDGGMNRITVPPSDLFEVRDNTQLWLKGGVEVDYEDASNPLHRYIAVLSSPENPDLGTLSYRLIITDIDDKPISMRLSLDSIDWAEGISTARKLSEVIMEDVDGGENLVTIDENTLFEIKNNTEIWLKAGIELDYESDRLIYEAQITYGGPGRLGDNPPAQIFTLNVTDIDDHAPTAFALIEDRSQLSEGITTAKKLTDINFSDVDAGVNRMTIEDNAIFEIRNNTELWLKGGVDIDYEDVNNPLHYYVAVLSSPENPDLGALFYTLHITDSDDKPFSLSLSANSIDRVEGTTTAIKLSEVIFEDVDGGENFITIPQMSIFEVRNNTEIWLKAGIELDYESGIISYEAQITYGGPGIIGDNPPVQIFTLNVTNIDDAPPSAFAPLEESSQLAEGLTIARKLTDIIFEDVDGGGNSVAITENELFEIKNNTELWVKGGVDIDYEDVSNPLHTYVAHLVSPENPDLGTLSYTLNITDIDDKPISINLSTNRFTFFGSVTTSKKLSDISFDDVDGGENLISLPYNEIFEIKNDTELWLKPYLYLNFDSGKTLYTVEVTYGGNGILGDDPQKTVFNFIVTTLYDIAPTAFAPTVDGSELAEGRTTAKKLTDISFSDTDGGTNRITIEDNALFEIRNNTELWLKRGVDIDYEDASAPLKTYKAVLASPEHPNLGTISYTLTITDRDDKPTAITLTTNRFAIGEGITTAKKLSEVNFDDADGGVNLVTIEDNALFEIINGTEIWLKAGIELNYDSDQTSYEAQITYGGPGVLGDNPPSQIFTLIVTNNDDAAPTAFTLLADNSQLTEGRTSAQKLTDISFSDSDGGANRITIEDNALFEIRNNTELWLKGGGDIDYENADNPLKNYVAVLSSPENPDLGSLSYTLTIIDSDDKPTQMHLTSNRVAIREGTTTAQKLSEVNFDDSDGGVNLAIIEDHALFEVVNGTEIWLKAGIVLDYDSDQSSYEAQITYGGPGLLGDNPLAQTFTLIVTNGEDASPTAFTPIIESSQMAEGRTSATKLTDIRFSDSDGGANRIIIEDSAIFEIRNNTQLWLKGGVDIDFENAGNPTHTHIAVLSSPENPDLGTQSYTLHITDSDDKPHSLSLTANSIDLVEGTTTALKLSEVIFEDVDGGENFITIPQMSIFEVRNNTEIWLKAGIALDYESGIISYAAQITYGGPGIVGDNPAAQIFTLNVTNSDDKPTALYLTPSSFDMAEGTSRAQKLSDISFDDVDGGVNVISVEENILFEIRNNTELWIKAGVTLDYESGTTRYDIDVFYAGTELIGENPLPKTFTLNVTNSDDNAPTSISILEESSQIGEGLKSETKLTDISFEDIDGGINRITIPQSAIFEIRNDTELWLKDGVNIDYEQLPSHRHVVVLSSPENPGLGTISYTLYVTDRDDNPNSLSLTTNRLEIGEGPTTERKLADVNFDDVDGGENRVSVSNNAIFEIKNGTELWLKAGLMLDYESSTTSYVAEVTYAGDGQIGDVPAPQNFLLDIVNTDERPISMTLTPSSFTIDEGVSIAQKLSNIYFDDADGGNNRVSVAQNSLFEIINGTDLWLKGGVNIDYENGISRYDVDITYAGSGILGDQLLPQIFSLFINNIDDAAPTAISLNQDSSERAEGITAEMLLATVDFDDVDGGLNRVIIAENAFFEIRNDTQLWLKGDVDLNYEDANNPAHRYVAVLSSPENPELGTISYTLTLTDLDDKPTSLSLSSNSFEMAEGLSTALKLADISFVDSDGGVNSAVVVSNDVFEIIGTELWLKGDVDLDYEGFQTNYIVEVIYAGEGILGDDPTPQLFTITLTNIDEKPTAIKPVVNGLSVEEGVTSSMKLTDINFIGDQIGSNAIIMTQGDSSLFEMRDGNELWLKAGIDLNYDSEQTNHVVKLAFVGEGVGDQPEAIRFTLTVTDINNLKPVFEGGGVSTNPLKQSKNLTPLTAMQEFRGGPNGHIIYTVAAIPDVIGHLVRYRLAGDGRDDDRELFEIYDEISGIIQFKQDTIVNKLVKNDYHITVIAEIDDGNGRITMKELGINVYVRGQDLIGGNANDMITLTRENDNIAAGGGNDTIFSNAGADHIDGGAGADMMSYLWSHEGVVVDLLDSSQNAGLHAVGDVLTNIENITGSKLSDILRGNNSNNILYGLGGADHLVGQGGHDILYGGSGSDQLFGGDGYDILIGGSGDDILDGGRGEDNLPASRTSYNGRPNIDGGTGFDSVSYKRSSSAVTVSLIAGARNFGGDAEGDVLINIENIIGSDYGDILTGGAGDDHFEGGGGADEIDGGAGSDTASYAGARTAIIVDMDSPSNNQGEALGDILINIENIIGSDYDDMITGGAGDNRLEGGGGADQIDGGAGIDSASYAGAQAKVIVDMVTLEDNQGEGAGDQFVSIENLIGSKFDDILRGDHHDNLLSGGAGDDRLEGRGGADWLDGGIGIDSVSYQGSSSAVTVNLDDSAPEVGGDAASDTLINIENIIGSLYADTLTGDGYDNIIEGGDGADIINGRDGIDTASYEGAVSRVIVDMATPANNIGEARGDRLTNIENLKGSLYDDRLTGDQGANILNGLGGADWLDGGAGEDTASYAHSAGVNVSLIAAIIGLGGDAEGDELTNIENLIGSDHSDILTGDDRQNILFGRDGNDILIGGAGAGIADILDGGAGSDTASYEGAAEVGNREIEVRLGGRETSYTINGLILDLNFPTDDDDYIVQADNNGEASGDRLRSIENITGSAQKDIIIGDGGANILDGGAEVDRLYGLAGDDILQGGSGSDILDGGAGRDTASYQSSDLRVVIDLTGIIANQYGDAYHDILISIENLIGSEFNDLFYANGTANVFDGGGGSDYVLYDHSPTGVIIDLSNLTLSPDDHPTRTNPQNDQLPIDSPQNSYAKGDVFVNIENIIGTNHHDYLKGNHVNNILLAVAGDDIIYGMGGADELYGGVGRDILYGGAGDDILDGQGHGDILIGGAGRDILIGGHGIDSISYEGSDDGVIVNLSLAANSDNYIVQVSEGHANGDMIREVENIIGSEGDDQLTGDEGANILIGGRGDDILDGGAGVDILDGGDGIDTVTYADHTHGVTISLSGMFMHFSSDAEISGLTNQQITVIGGTDTSIILTNDGTFLALGDEAIAALLAGSYVVVVALNHDDGSQVAQTQYGGSYLFTAYELTYTLILDDQAVSNLLRDGIFGINMTVSSEILMNIENLIGTDYNDVLLGSERGDVIDGGSGDDHLDGGSGDDVLRGGDGDDLLIGGTGADELIGGTGSDTAAYISSDGGVMVSLSDFTIQTDDDPALTNEQTGGHAAGDRLSGIEHLIGSAYNDRLTGSGVDNIFDGGDGADEIDGRAGNDTVSYNESDAGVVVNLSDLTSLSDDDPTLTNAQTGGYAAGDRLKNIENLIGTAYIDTLTGSSGNNILDGGAGADNLSGGSENNDDDDTVTYARSDLGVDVNLITGIGKKGHAAGDRLTEIEHLIGSRFADFLIGDNSANLFDGGEGIDTVSYRFSSSGVIISMVDSDRNQGGHGQGDRLINIENLIGSQYNDEFIGDRHDNKIEGGSGDDFILGGRGNDWLKGDGGIDTLFGGEGDDLLEGGGGGDTLYGGLGIDTVSYRSSQSGVLIDLSFAFSILGDATGDRITDIENIIGSDYNDTLTGDNENNKIEGRGGNDVLVGRGGHDILDGGEGRDTVTYRHAILGVTINMLDMNDNTGEAQGHTMISIEIIIGSIFNDNLTGDNNANTFKGGRGNDILNGGANYDFLMGEEGNDTLNGGADGDILNGGEGVDTLNGGTGDDVLDGGEGGDILNGGEGRDAVLYNRSESAIIINLASQTVSGGIATGDTLDSIEDIFGSYYHDNLTGDDGDNRLYGDRGNDVVTGGGGDDLINGGDGDDVMNGGDGDDLFFGGHGTDTLNGGSGSDTSSYFYASTSVTINLATETFIGDRAAGDTLNSVENLIGSRNNDSLTGDAGANILDGSHGNDTLTGGDGADIFVLNKSHTGVNTVTDFRDGVDKVRVHVDEDTLLSSPTSFTNINIAVRNNGENTNIVNLQDESEIYMIIENIEAYQLTFLDIELI